MVLIIVMVVVVAGTSGVGGIMIDGRSGGGDSNGGCSSR